jgi:7-carboxy-7-deazaguanine synthase
MRYNIIEKFLSIDGEGPTAGELAAFIRFGGCNLSCAWCDTAYSIDFNTAGEQLTKEEIYSFVKGTGARNVTVTGGEPLIQDGVEELIYHLAMDPELMVHIETNGSVPVRSFRSLTPLANVSFIVDYKLPDSRMEDRMDLGNFEHISSKDVCKFVIGSPEDMEKAREIIDRYSLEEKCLVYLSPITSLIEPVEIVEFMKKNRMNRVRLQLQLHKIIWSPDTKGV